MRLGISACVLGDPVRYNGGHKYSSYCAEQLKQVSWVKICPEVLAGMGVPRPTLHLQRVEQSGTSEYLVQAVVSATGEDVSNLLTDLVTQLEQQLCDLDGYVFCTRSPSCGVNSAPLLDPMTREQVGTTSGLFAAQLKQRFPALPVIENIALEEPLLGNNFLMRATIYRALRQLNQPYDLAALKAFTEYLQPLLRLSEKSNLAEFDQQQPQQRYSEQLMALLAQLTKPEHAATVARYIQ